MKQSGLTVITKIQSGCERTLPSVIESKGASIPFNSISSLHYAAFVVIPAVEGFPIRLVLETNYDGDLGAHLDELIRLGAAGLDQIYKSCTGYPAGGAQNEPEGVKEYFIKNSYPSTAFYVALPGRSRDDIGNAIGVYNEAKKFLDADSTLADLGQDQVWARLVEHFRGSSALKPQRSPVTQTRLKWQVVLRALVWFAPAALFLLFVVPILFLIARFHERREARSPVPAPRYQTDRKRTYEYLNLGPQNHMCTFATVKAGWFRAFMIRLTLLIVGFAASRFFILGKLDRMTSIHFARWILIDGNKRVLFLANFDGSWSSYIDDFSDPPRLNAVWGNTERFPPTWFMLWEGARNIQTFQEHVVEEFQPTYFYYQPYIREYSVENLLRYLEFRDALARALR